MLLDRQNSNTRSFSARFSSAPRTTLAALVALGIVGLAPQLAQADEAGTAAAVEETFSAPAPVADLARPLTMRGVGTRSSVGVSLEGSDTGLDAIEDTFHVYSGIVKLDGEITFGGHFKLFGSVPFTGITGDHGAERIAGHGNLTLGGQVQGGEGPLRLAFGGSFSKWGDADSVPAVYSTGDVTAFAIDRTIVQGFATLRGGTDERFVQAQLTYDNLMTDGSSSDRSQDAQFGQVMVGGGLRVAPSVMVLAEAGIVRSLDEAPEGSKGDRNLYTGQIGVRGGVGGSGASWSAKLTGSHGEGVNSFGAGLELRTDLPGLSGR